MLCTSIPYMSAQSKARRVEIQYDVLFKLRNGHGDHGIKKLGSGRWKSDSRSVHCHPYIHSHTAKMAAVQSSPAPMLSPLLMQNTAGPSSSSVHSTQSPARQAPAKAASPPTPVKRVTKSRSRSATPGERRYKCQYEGCDKAYTKPSRLAEHELSHTGEVGPASGDGRTS